MFCLVKKLIHLLLLLLYLLGNKSQTTTVWKGKNTTTIQLFTIQQQYHEELSFGFKRILLQVLT